MGHPNGDTTYINTQKENSAAGVRPQTWKLVFTFKYPSHTSKSQRV